MNTTLRLLRWLLDCLEVSPTQVGFPGARSAARLQTRVRRNGKWERETVYLISSRSLDDLEAKGMLRLKRQYWVIESRLVVRLPLLRNGRLGPPEVWKQVGDVPESVFYQNPFIPLMLDGLALDVQGNIYIAVPSRGAIIRINADDQSQETLAVYPGSPLLDAPVSMAFGTGKGERESLFITNLGISGTIVPALPWAGPGLLKLDVGIPGLPLP